MLDCKKHYINSEIVKKYNLVNVEERLNPRTILSIDTRSMRVSLTSIIL